MNLQAFEGKRVKIIDDEGRVFEGVVGDYIFPEDNPPMMIEAVILDDVAGFGNPIQIDKDQIKSIEIIKP